MNSSNPLSYKIQRLVSSALQLPEEQILAELAFGDMPEWDSMGHMEIMMTLEEQYGVEINADIIGSLTSIPLICDYLKENGYV